MTTAVTQKLQVRRFEKPLLNPGCYADHAHWIVCSWSKSTFEVPVSNVRKKVGFSGADATWYLHRRTAWNQWRPLIKFRTDLRLQHQSQHRKSARKKEMLPRNQSLKPREGKSLSDFTKMCDGWNKGLVFTDTRFRPGLMLVYRTMEDTANGLGV